MKPRALTGSVALAGAGACALAAILLGLDRSSPAGIAQGSSWLLPGLSAVAGFGLLAIALRFGSASAVVPAVGLLGVALLLGLPSAGSWRAATPLAGAWLLAIAELSSWSIDLRVRGIDAPVVYRHRAAAIIGVLAFGLVLAATVEVGLDPIDLGGLELTALGLLAGATLIGLAATLAWRLRPDDSTSDPHLPGERPVR